MKGLNGSKIRLPARASIWYLGASSVCKAVGFLATPFFTRIIDTAAYGEMTLYLTVLGIGSILCSSINGGSAFYKSAQQYREQKSNFLTSALLLSVSFSLLICTLLFALSHIFRLPALLYIPLTIQIVCDSIIGVFLSFGRFSYQYKSVTAITVISSVIPTVASIFLLYNYDADYKIRIYSMLLVSICTAIYAIIKILTYKGTFRRSVMNSLVKTALPLLPKGISSAVYAQSDKLILTMLLGTSALAKYSVAHSLGTGLQFIFTALTSVLGPWTIRKLDQNNTRALSNLYPTLVKGFFAISLCLLAVAPEAMKILAPKEYLEAFPALLPLLMSTPIMLASYPITLVFINDGQSKAAITVSLCEIISNLTFSLLLIPPFGFLGAGLSMLLAQLFGFIVGILLLNLSRKERSLYVTKLLKKSAIYLLLGIAISASLNHIAIRVLLLIVPAVMLLKDFYSLREVIVE